MQESLNWLLQNKEYDKALDLIKDIGRINKRPLETENLLLSEKIKVNRELIACLHLHKRSGLFGGHPIKANLNSFQKPLIG